MTVLACLMVANHSAFRISRQIALGAEVWSNRRRMKVVEALLEEKGITNAMIEQYMPTAEQEAEWQKDRDRFIDLTYSPLLREGNLPVSESEKRCGETI